MATFKLSQNVQDRLANLPETGMGYQKATLIFSDKKVPNVIISNGTHFESNEDIDMNKLEKIILQNS